MSHIIFLRKLLILLTFLSSHDALALNIALTNDDGWNAMGIQQMKLALISAGHNVTLAAPTENQSASSSAIDFGFSNIQVTKQKQSEYSVSLSNGLDAEPGTTSLIAISIAESRGDKVDLLISGINNGSNTGASTIISGTVGAAIAAVSTVSNNSIPAISISTDEIRPLALCGDSYYEQCMIENKLHFEAVAQWMVIFIKELEKKPGKLKHEKRLLVDGVVLNINYPPLKNIKGVSLNRQGNLFWQLGEKVNFSIGCYEDCNSMDVGSSILAGITNITKSKDNELSKSDSLLYNDGYITIVPIQLDLSANRHTRNKFSKLVHNMNDHFEN
ncbi:MAG: 5'/3'-nucleotidase SurE [Pseudomonadota bacterium]